MKMNLNPPEKFEIRNSKFEIFGVWNAHCLGLPIVTGGLRDFPFPNFEFQISNFPP
jgi:hypothetical protein